MNILIIGTGMYVSGRGTKGYGTILPAISTFHKESKCISKLFVVGTNVQRTQKAEIKSQQLSKLTGVELPVEFFPVLDSGRHLPGPLPQSFASIPPQEVSANTADSSNLTFHGQTRNLIWRLFQN